MDSLQSIAITKPYHIAIVCLLCMILYDCGLCFEPVVHLFNSTSAHGFKQPKSLIVTLPRLLGRERMVKLVLIVGLLIQSANSVLI